MIWFFVAVLSLFFFFIKKKNEEVFYEEKKAEKWREEFLKKEYINKNLFKKLVDFSHSSDFQKQLRFLRKKVSDKKDSPLVSIDRVVSFENDVSAYKCHFDFSHSKTMEGELSEAFYDVIDKRYGDEFVKQQLKNLKNEKFSGRASVYVNYFKEYLPTYDVLKCSGGTICYDDFIPIDARSYIDKGKKIFVLEKLVDLRGSFLFFPKLASPYGDDIYGKGNSFYYDGGDFCYVLYDKFFIRIDFGDADRCLLFLMMLIDYNIRLQKQLTFLVYEDLEKRELEVFRRYFESLYYKDRENKNALGDLKKLEEWRNFQDYSDGVEKIKRKYENMREDYKQKMFGSEK